MRGDATADYSAVTTQYQGSGNFWLWYYAFRPYGTYYGGTYHHAGYYSGAISQSSNVGTSFSKSAIITGGFGHGTVSVSS